MECAPGFEDKAKCGAPSNGRAEDNGKCDGLSGDSAYGVRLVTMFTACLAVDYGFPYCGSRGNSRLNSNHPDHVHSPA